MYSFYFEELAHDCVHDIIFNVTVGEFTQPERRKTSMRKT